MVGSEVNRRSLFVGESCGGLGVCTLGTMNIPAAICLVVNKTASKEKCGLFNDGLEVV